MNLQVLKDSQSDDGENGPVGDREMHHLFNSIGCAPQPLKRFTPANTLILPHFARGEDPYKGPFNT